MMFAARLFLFLVVVSASGCSISSSSQEDAELSVLFVGNSLTYVHDLPEVVAELGRLQQYPIRVQSVVAPNVSLEQHWALGDAQEALEEGGWDVVVLQQGPSTLSASREHLVQWVGRFADEARVHGTEPAVYMVWPPEGTSITLSEASYAEAATTHSARLLPAGRAWRLAMESDTPVDLYGPDRFHPSTTGTLLAALTIYGGLHELPAQLPPEITVDGQAIALTTPVQSALLRAAREALSQ